MPPVVRFAVPGGVHIHGQVAAFAADPGDHQDRHIGIGTGALQQTVRILVRGHFRRGEIGAGIAALLGAADAGVFIEGHELIVDLQPRVGEALHHVHVGGGIAAAAARAAINGVNGSVTEQIDLGSAFQGQSAVFVPQQHDALAFQLFSHGKALFGGFGHA